MRQREIHSYEWYIEMSTEDVAHFHSFSPSFGSIMIYEGAIHSILRITQ